jgi:heme-degrading monooxygenase HmoA
VLEPTAGAGDTVVLTIWPSHEVFDAWIATPERDALTASDVHHSVDYRPITRYEIAGGYLNTAGLGDQPDTFPTT